MKPLTQDQLKRVLKYNPKTGVFTWITSANSHVKAGDAAGYVNHHGYVFIGVFGRCYSAHRLVWLYCHGNFPANEVDHRDGNKSNNRLDNLREATHSENARNTKIKISNKSGFKGVSWNSLTGKYKAQIGINYKTNYIGLFKTPREASLAYEAAAIRLFGEFKRKIA